VLYDTSAANAVANSSNETLVSMAYNSNLPLSNILATNHNLAWLAPLNFNKGRGLELGPVSFQELLRMQESFCTLILLVPDNVPKDSILAEMRLLNPQLATSIFLVSKPSQALEADPWSARIPGIRLR
jgi:hypothetical protein